MGIGGGLQDAGQSGVDLPSGRTFPLKSLAMENMVCLIPTGDTFVLAGAINTNTGTFGLVERYSSNGVFIENLPSLQEFYWNLGCGSFKDDHGNTALIVVGRGGGPDPDHMTEAKILYDGTEAWVPGPDFPDAT